MEKKNIKSKLVAGGLLITTLAYTSPVLAYTKDETVYSKMKNNGENYHTTVSTHLENTDNEKILNDLTTLLNIQNTNGNESFEQDGENLIWQSDGKDIYYKGESENSLPITCKIKYTLDGKEISAKELAGKSGKVTIELTYTNQEKHPVNINGKSTTLYTPFFVVAGTILSNETNKNITVTNGKVINDGSKTFIAGVAMPGMKESLGISDKKVNLSDTIQISMDTVDFELENIVTIATPKVLEKEDLSVLNDLDEIYAKVNTLQSSSQELENGANTLKQGTNQYYEKSQEFHQAMQQVEKGSNSANSQYSKINEGISKVTDTTNTLNQGAQTISSGTKAVQANLETIVSNLEKLEKGSNELKTGGKKASEGVNQIKNVVNTIANQDHTTEIAQLEGLIKQNQSVIASLSTTPQEETANALVIKLLKGNNQALQSSLDTLKESQKSLTTLNKSLTDLKSGVDGLTTGIESSSEAISKLKVGTNTLTSKSRELVAGSNKLYEGTQGLKEGTKTLKAGSSQMKVGLSTLQKGSSELLNANFQLTDGAKTIQEGATTLANGIHEFNQQGINPICNYINGELKDMTNRAKELIKLSEDYQTFTELKEGEEGNVKFIMMSDSIKKKKQENNNQAILMDNNSSSSDKKEK